MLALAAPSAGAFPNFVTYQGRYLQSGVPTNGPVAMEFRIVKNAATIACGTAADANLFWTSGSTNVPTTNGLFSYKLGLQADGAAQDPAFLNLNWGLANTTFYIDVCVAGTALKPQEALGASAFAFYASSASYAATAGNAEGNTFVSSKTFSNDVKVVGTLSIAQGALVVELANGSGGALAAGDLVVVDSANDDSVTTTITVSDPKVAGVVVTGGAAGAQIKVAIAGIVTVNVAGAVSRGDCLGSSGTAGLAQADGACNTAGLFATALTSSTGPGTVRALLPGPRAVDGTGGG